MLQIFENLERKIALGNITGNLGKVIEYDDIIVCYVNKRSVLKDRKSTRLNSSHYQQSRMPSSA